MLSMVDGIKAEEIALYQAVLEADHINKDCLQKIGDVESFFYTMIYPYEKFLNGFLSSKIEGISDKAKWLFLNSEFVEAQLDEIIQVYEGFNCHADKSRTIINALAQFLIKGDRIEWNYDQEFTYHLPKKVFSVHEEIVCFFEALRSLHHGNTEEYLMVIQRYWPKK